jgi:hypothetical protein
MYYIRTASSSWVDIEFEPLFSRSPLVCLHSLRTSRCGPPRSTNKNRGHQDASATHHSHMNLRLSSSRARRLTRQTLPQHRLRNPTFPLGRTSRLFGRRHRAQEGPARVGRVPRTMPDVAESTRTGLGPSRTRRARGGPVQVRYVPRTMPNTAESAHPRPVPPRPHRLEKDPCKFNVSPRRCEMERGLAVPGLGHRERAVLELF